MDIYLDHIFRGVAVTESDIKWAVRDIGGRGDLGRVKKIGREVHFILN